MKGNGELLANLVQIDERRITRTRVRWEAGRIVSLEDEKGLGNGLPYLIPGFVDAHVHIESSMLVPSEFARLAVRHGTLAAVSDPHEIANVLGVNGVRFMLDNAARTPFRILFGAPSCVPATPFETAGARLGIEETEALLSDPQIGYLSEMMNFPGVLAGDPEVLAKIAAARRRGMAVDGHAPGVRGEDARRYAEAGITTDHECFDLNEAREKIAAGMAVLIREGSAARNFKTLHPLIDEYPDRVMFCSDDKHPDDLVEGHINHLVARAVTLGHDLFDVLRCACLNPVEHYGLRLGRLRLGDPMDAVLVTDLHDFIPERCWLDGEVVAENGRCLLPHLRVEPVNRFEARPITEEELRIPGDAGAIRVIEAVDGELVTGERIESPLVSGGWIVPDLERDLLPICVVNRYQPAPPALGYIHNFGLRRGAIASSVAHDSHNVIGVGASQADLLSAINAVIGAKGGSAVAEGGVVELLELPEAGLMAGDEGDLVAARYAELDRRAKGLGSALRAPFMTLSFMALLVIPELKLSDRGLFDGRTFSFTSLIKTG